eukprot:1721450-Rhodomonas_salina.1
MEKAWPCQDGTRAFEEDYKEPGHREDYKRAWVSSSSSLSLPRLAPIFFFSFSSPALFATCPQHVSERVRRAHAATETTHGVKRRGQKGKGGGREGKRAKGVGVEERGVE